MHPDGTILRRSGRRYGYVAVHNYHMCTKFEDGDIRGHLTFHSTRAAAGKKRPGETEKSPETSLK